jgi:hypothetical protein
MGLFRDKIFDQMIKDNIIDSRNKKFVAQILTNLTYIAGYKIEKQESIDFVNNRIPKFNTSKEVCISIQYQKVIFSQIYKDGFLVLCNLLMDEILEINQKANWFTMKTAIKFKFIAGSALNLLLLGTSDSTGGVIQEVGKYFSTKG